MLDQEKDGSNYNLNICDLPRSELEDQLNFYKNELDKKDELIRELTRLTAAGANNSANRTIRQSLNSANKLEEIRTKVEKLQDTVAQNKELIEQKNIVICELRAENESMRVENLSYIQRIEELESLLEEKADQVNNLGTAQEQNDIVVQSLQKDIKLKNSAIFDAKSQLRTLEERYKAKLAKEESTSKALKDAFMEIAKLLDCDPNSSTCVLKLTELLSMNSSYKTQLIQKNDVREAFEFEQRAARETISRLSGELNREKKEKESALAAQQATNQKLQETTALHEQSEARCHLMEDRIEQLTKALHSAHADAKEKDRRYAILGETKARIQSEQSTTEKNSQPSSECPMNCLGVWNDFLKQLSSWLKLPAGEQPPRIVSATWDRIHEIEENSAKYLETIRELENELMNGKDENIASELEQLQVRERIDELERRRAADGATIDNLRAERLQLHDQLCKIAQAAKFDEPIVEEDLRIIGETLQARVAQLQQGDSEKQTKQRLQISRQQRELREARERTESLELQVSILRRRLAEAQENRLHNATPASNTPTTLAASEKERLRLSKQLDQTREENEKLREEIVLLKSQLLGSSQAKLAHIGTSKALKSTEAKFDELSKSYEAQKQEARKLHIELEHCKKRFGTESKKMQEERDALERDLQMTREGLEASRHSEQQLLEFRALVARQLGLDNDSLSVPDYEILTHLNRLVDHSHAHMASVVAAERALNLIHGNVKNGDRQRRY
ncbi:unnamed protein product [Calicophoron daubneyi]|uniref:Uncharacterized protein n=1 Tax=Calicophoron daubneyi TaxID=300641 RepID=A0AAV2TPC9_CALDB